MYLAADEKRVVLVKLNPSIDLMVKSLLVAYFI